MQLLVVLSRPNVFARQVLNSHPPSLLLYFVYSPYIKNQYRIGLHIMNLCVVIHNYVGYGVYIHNDLIDI